MNKQFENEGIIMKRIRHQLKIHWNWLRREKDSDVVANFISCWMKQALSRGDKDIEMEQK